MTIYRQDPERGFRVWSIHEIYDPSSGRTSAGPLHVPNIDDLVSDRTYLYTVTAVDPVTAVPTLTLVGGDRDASDVDSLYGAFRKHEALSANRIFLNTNTQPFTLSINCQFTVLGSEFTKLRLFKGTDTSDTGTVVSQTINERGAVVSELIPILPIDPANNAIRRPSRGHTGYRLQDGETVTGVVYNDAGMAVDEYRFTVVNADQIVSSDVSNVYIEDIELITPLLSEDDPTLLLNRLNVPFSSSTFICRVHYNDGEYSDHPIDGNRAKISGLTNFNTSILGPVSQISLVYCPSTAEQAINVGGATVPVISKTYRLANIPTDTNNAFAIYVIPKCVDGVYTLHARLLDVHYSINIDISNKVIIKGQNNADFDGITKGVSQTLDLTIRLDDVVPGAYPDMVHTQRIKLVLNDPNSITDDNWVIDYLGDGMSHYGIGTYATASSLDYKVFNVGCGKTSVAEWLQALYYTLDPIFDPTVLSSAPVPTHFRLSNGGSDGMAEIGTYPLSEFNVDKELGYNRVWAREWPINIEWLILSQGNAEQILAISPLSIENDI